MTNQPMIDTQDLRDGDRVSLGDDMGTVVKTTKDTIHVFWDHNRLTGVFRRGGLAKQLRKVDSTNV